jgi:hypothetical protein
VTMQTLQTSAPWERAAVTILAPLVWRWFDENRDAVVLTRRILAWTVTVRLHHFEPALLCLFPRPRPSRTGLVDPQAMLYPAGQ